MELPISKTSLTAYTNPTPEDLTFDWKLVSFNLANDQNKFQGRFKVKNRLKPTRDFGDDSLKWRIQLA